MVVPDIADIQFTTKLSQDILEGKISFVAALSIFNDKFEDDVIVDWWGYFDDLLTSKEPGAAWIREIYWNEYYDDIMEDSSDIPDDHIDHFIKWLNQYTD